MSKDSGCGFRIYMPHGGEDGVIIVRSVATGHVVEFRGTPYSKWEEGESSDFYKIHSAIKRVDISRIHSDEVETVTYWHGDEWVFIYQIFIAAEAGITREQYIDSCWWAKYREDPYKV
jgi:hypothetical protein